MGEAQQFSAPVELEIVLLSAVSEYASASGSSPNVGGSLMLEGDEQSFSLSAAAAVPLDSLETTQPGMTGLLKQKQELAVFQGHHLPHLYYVGCSLCLSATLK